MSLRYSVKKSLILGRYYVYDHIEMQCAFRGSYEDCHDWIDNPLKLALKQGEMIKKALEEKK